MYPAEEARESGHRLGLSLPGACHCQAAIAQLGERQTEDLKVPSSILGLGMLVAKDVAARLGLPVHGWAYLLRFGMRHAPLKPSSPTSPRTPTTSGMQKTAKVVCHGVLVHMLSGICLWHPWKSVGRPGT